MFAEVLAIAGVIGVPFSAGFVSRFAKGRWLSRLVMALAFLPLLLLFAYALVTDLRRLGAEHVGLLVTALAVCGLFLLLGRAFGRPFAEIAEERRRERTRRTFD